MPSFKPTGLWNAEPHTLAKIEIVRRYLFLWFRILGTKANRLVYIDGFSGPGRYLNSNQSSPIAALTSAKAAFDELVKSRRVPKEWLFYFIDQNASCTSSLKDVIEETSLPEQFKAYPKTGKFEQKLAEVLDEVKKLPGDVAPTFAFIDPFGATGAPFKQVAEILKHRSCEVLINLDSDGIGRLCAAQSIEKNKVNLDAIFGGDMWKNALNPHAKLPILCSQVLALYKSRLQSLPAVEYFFSFAMRSRREVLNYHLVFASQHWLGLEKMKEAMKAVDQSGSYSFSDDAVGQGYFNFSDVVEPATRMLVTLGGKWRPYGDYRKFALNESIFSNPKSMLQHLKAEGKVEVEWVGKPATRGFPEDKIKLIKLNP